MTENSYDYHTYLSPFTWRYGSNPMRAIWSEVHKRLLWRRIWVALAQSQTEFGLVTENQLTEIKEHENEVDLPQALSLESEIHHDLMAELKVFASQCPTGGGILHLGATSMDIEDNADALRIKQALEILMQKLSQLLLDFAEKIDQWADQPVIGFTHLQPAAPTTLGYRFSLYAQDLFNDWTSIQNQKDRVKGKGFKGAVGTSTTYADLIGIDSLQEFENNLSRLLDLNFYPVSSQTYPRKQDYDVLCSLAGLGASLHKFAFDLRLLQSPALGEISEPFAARQVGSSAMPFKRNPITAEKINSLARSLAQMPRVAWDNAANSLLERTLDDSANRRSLMAEACLICDELLMDAHNILAGMKVDQVAINRNIETYWPFSATENVLAALVKQGANRQEMHERLRVLSMNAWEAIQSGNANPLSKSIEDENSFTRYLSRTELSGIIRSRPEVGAAPIAAKHLAAQIKTKVSS